MLLRPTLLALLATTASAGDLIVVDETGAGDHTTIPAAVAAATDGDTVLIVGPYLTKHPLQIDGKAITVVHQDPGEKLMLTSIRVENLPAGHEVVLSSLRPHLTATPVVTLLHNAGRVVLDGVGTPGSSSDHEVHVHDCADVVLNDCTFNGRDGYLDACNQWEADGTPALEVNGASRVSLYGSTLTGGDAGYDFCFFEDGFPAPAILAGQTSVVFSAGCTLAGGDGSAPVVLTGAATHTEFSGPANQFIGPSIATQGQTSNLRVTGAVGHRAVLLLGEQGTYRGFGALQGVLHVRPTTVVPMGTIPPGGVLTFPFQQPAPPLGSEAEVLHAQVRLYAPAGDFGLAAVAERFYLSNPKAWAVSN